MPAPRTLRVTLLLLPLLLTWPLGWAISESILNFGGGEKDIILIFPWAIWSIIYAIAGAVYWTKGRALGAATGRAAAVATLLTFGALMAVAFGLPLLQRG